MLDPAAVTTPEPVLDDAELAPGPVPVPGPVLGPVLTNVATRAVTSRAGP